ncbi:rhomboid family intramembrane serine protease [Akkermansiaceae bacterium]|nr:rhomboid family intramembrane serine protease [Akkermansiaceae bacterium]
MAFNGRRVSYGRGMLAQLTPVVKWLIILNLSFFFLDMLFLDWKLRNEFAFSVRSALLEFRIWEFVTFQFLHKDLGHVLLNCVGLFFFGPWMERWWGARQFLFFYLACGVAGAVLYSSLGLAGFLPGDNLYSGLVGASAGIYGILVGVAVIAPSLRLSLILLPVSFTMRQLAVFALIVSAASIAFRFGGNEGGEAGHLGGAIMGYLMMKTHGWMGWMGKTVRRRKGRPASDFTAKIRPRTIVDLDGSTEVDRILDKISKDGFPSLTDEERDYLRKAAESGDKAGL